MPNNRTQVLETSSKEESAFCNLLDNSICLNKESDNSNNNANKQTKSNYKNKCASVHSPSPKKEGSTKIRRPLSFDDKMILPVGQLIEIAKQQRNEQIKTVNKDDENDLVDVEAKESNDSEISAEPLTTSEEESKDTTTSDDCQTDDNKSLESAAVINKKTTDKIKDNKVDCIPRSQSCVVPISQKDVGIKERETRRWSVEDGGSAIVSGVISRPGSSGSVPYQVYLLNVIHCCLLGCVPIQIKYEFR